MAQRTRVELVDDFDGGAAEETVSFSIDGKNYEIDLSAGNASKFRSVFEPYISAGRKITQGRRQRKVSGPTSDAGDIRAWAIRQGLEVSTRGRVSAEIRQAYAAANR